MWTVVTVIETVKRTYLVENHSTTHAAREAAKKEYLADKRGEVAPTNQSNNIRMIDHKEEIVSVVNATNHEED